MVAYIFPCSGRFDPLSGGHLEPAACHPSHAAQQFMRRPAAFRVGKKDLALAPGFWPVVPALEQRQMAPADGGRWDLKACPERSRMSAPKTLKRGWAFAPAESSDTRKAPRRRLPEED